MAAAVVMTPELKISRSITKLMYQYPFWGALAIGTEFVRSETCKTMATNGLWIKWNPEFVNSITEAECVGVIAHEICHIILKHMLRFGNRKAGKWNHACDYAINPILTKEGFSLPAGGLLDPKFTNMTAEKVYELLPENDGDQAPLWGEVVPANDPSQPGQGVDAEVIEADIDQRISSAIAHAKSRGSVPSIAKMLLDEMEEAQIDWRDKVRRFLTGDQPDDYSFRRPERKIYRQLGIVAPSIEHRGAGDIVIGIDTSGSVSDKELRHFLGEINAISNELKPKSITVIACDAVIHSIETYEGGEEVRSVKINGRGGTCVMPVFKHIEKNDLPVSHMIYLTDMEVHDFPARVDFPLLWVSTARSGEAPVGETVRIKVK